ncbi:conjugative transposon protein TraN [Flavobacterium defluvii]|uniref:Bacteroides conjugative transposon TraN protein n=1 Tax=Flavobacterium defluvii TaxID=370979 RepID=A0A1M5JGN4_9FLAO|nr:conjugative transposon protein TraN [Flavobacterium defluvii]SHG39555.1 Bacteroides conjugative transposon TraN protein [Flavobacterium defluvii]
MKRYYEKYWTALLAVLCVQLCFPQSSLPVMDEIKACRLGITYDKTSHLIFPSEIRYADLGSELLMAGKAEDAHNVLRVKAAVRDFEQQTNLSVMTIDGHFYSFDVHYDPNPQTLSYRMGKSGSIGSEGALFENLGQSSPLMVETLMQRIYERDKRAVRHRRTRDAGVEFRLKGIYVHEGKYYLHTELRNSNNVPYRIDFLNFKIADRKKARRTAVQQTAILPLRIYRPVDQIKAGGSEHNIYVLDLFTLADGKLLLIEIYEKNGGRQLTLKIKNSDLLKACLLNNP